MDGDGSLEAECVRTRSRAVCSEDRRRNSILPSPLNAGRSLGWISGAAGGWQRCGQGGILSGVWSPEMPPQPPRALRWEVVSLMQERTIAHLQPSHRSSGILTRREGTTDGILAAVSAAWRIIQLVLSRSPLSPCTPPLRGCWLEPLFRSPCYPCRRTGRG